ncbi:3,4-dihydroxy-2-butanone-4-phosphate synthase [Rhodococcus jostii]|uniref:3,4-dihydroxy-2-butanone-4-phosphate synthase n=1 Tax=Rhodococcus jostii TaxID=132919 RepID=A0ABU4CN18_RHOJO|nr:3,4-dihydroxy-2-butanone-4-phosphate synthase [Rhodococcus jostii]MDV6284512.1 3,4-dihydroxy-2-butanone-4-phosphate synthase [Rhodococcus jostii]
MILSNADIKPSAEADAVDRALCALAGEECVVLIDDLSPTGAATIVAAARTITTTRMATLIRLGSGFVEIGVDYGIARRLQIPIMAGIDLNDTPTVQGEFSGVGVDATTGVSTGISAADRARTARVIASPNSTSADLRRPGHLLPVLISDLAARQPESLRTGALALAREATNVPAAVHCELTSPSRDTEMATMHEAFQIARRNRIPAVTLSSIHVLVGKSWGLNSD